MSIHREKNPTAQHCDRQKRCNTNTSPSPRAIPFQHLLLSPVAMNSLRTIVLKLPATFPIAELVKLSKITRRWRTGI